MKINKEKLFEYELQPYEPRGEYEVCEREYFYRSPRFKRDISAFKLKVDMPPPKQSGDEIPLMMSMGPAMTMGIASLSTGIYGFLNGNKLAAITSGSMLAGTVLWPVLTKRFERRRRAQKENMRIDKYRIYIERLKNRIYKECEYQKEILDENIIGIEECERRIEARDRKLWERMPGQNDFLELRFGVGAIELNEEIQYPAKKFVIEEDVLEEELYEFLDGPRLLKNVPISISLYENHITGIVGVDEYTDEFVNGLILQLAALYSYDEVKLVFISDSVDFSYVKWLPHIWSNDMAIRFYAASKQDLKYISEVLEAVIEKRRALSDEEIKNCEPYYVVFCLNNDIGFSSELISKICTSKKRVNFSLIYCCRALQYLPKECTKIIELKNTSEARLYDKDDITGKVLSFRPDIFKASASMEGISKGLANIFLDIYKGAFVMPRLIGFLDMYKVGRIEHLNPLNRWKENDPTKTLGAIIGVDAKGEDFVLNIHEKGDGPHGLIAGMTGSGKSELIMTYILSMAVNYSPYEVAFVFIDYKGGGMAKTFEELPHTAGIITNLDGAEVKRSLLSNQFVLNRRQKILAEKGKSHGICNIDIYKYQKMYREGSVSEPLQHLIIISDEFAELKMGQSEFMAQLISAARIGRSLGVHLILATQKPAGIVDDQIWSNSRFRICLKVQDKTDSMDMLKRPEAAALNDTGRFYMQVGYNEVFRMGHSAWAGAPYYPSDAPLKVSDESIEIVNSSGERLISAEIDKSRGLHLKPVKQADEITKYLAAIAKDENISIRPLWLKPLPAHIYIDELAKKYKWQKDDELNPIIGEYDDPANQLRRLLSLPFTREGNAILYGGERSGKTTLITTLIYSLISLYEPSDVNIYILDFASETLSAFADAPHVGDIVFSYEAEKVNNLFKLLMGQLQLRKRLLADFGGDILLYNRISDKRLPFIVTVLNGYAAFAESYENNLMQLQMLTREGCKYGIYFIITLTGSSGMGYRLIQNFKQVLTLQLSSENDYSSVIGKTEGLIPAKYKGRGLIRLGAVYEFQSAEPFKGENVFSKIRDECKKMGEKSPLKAKRIPVLPEIVDIKFLKKDIRNDTMLLPIGVAADSLETVFFDFGKNYISHIQSRDDEYVDFINALAMLIKDKILTETIILDPLNSLNTRLNAVTGISALNEAAGALFEEVLKRHNEAKSAAENGLCKPAYERKTVIIASLSEVLTLLDEERSEMLKLVLEKGRTALNIYIIAADSAKGASGFAYERWFQTNSSQNDAVWIGGGIADLYNIKISRTTSEMIRELPEGFGFCITCGKAIKFKALSKV